MPEEIQLGTGISVIFEKKVGIDSRKKQYDSNNDNYNRVN